MRIVLRSREWGQKIASRSEKQQDGFEGLRC